MLSPNQTLPDAASPTGVDQAFALFQTGHLAEAAAILETCLRQNPNDFDACLGLGLVLGQAGDLDGACTRLMQALSLKPDDRNARLNLIGLLLTQRRLREAADWIVTGLIRFPGDPDLRRGRVELERLRKLQRLPLSVVSQASAAPGSFTEAERQAASAMTDRITRDIRAGGGLVRSERPRAILFLGGRTVARISGSVYKILWLSEPPPGCAEVLGDYDAILLADGIPAETLHAPGRKLGRANPDTLASTVLDLLAGVDEEALEIRRKNEYMTAIWAPVKGKLETDRVRRPKLVTAEECVGSVLDVGCANGDSTAIMKAHNPALTLTGLELADWAVREASRNHPDIPFVQGNAHALPFPDRSFDTVVLDHVIEHVADPVPLLLEAKRVARQRVVVGIPVLHLNDPDHQFAWSIPDFRALLTGFFPRHTLRGMREPDSLEVQDERAFRFAVGTGYLADGDRKEPVLPSPLRLHLGCGRNRLPGFLNVDIVPGPAVDLVADSQRLPLLAGSVHEIATFHMIEHLSRHDFIKALYEWNRVLAEGGRLAIECPDFDAVVREYAAGKTWRLTNIFGLQRHEGDFHRFGYTFETLAAALAAAGFGGIRREAPTDYHTREEPCMRVTAVKTWEVVRPPDLHEAVIRQAMAAYQQALKGHPTASPPPRPVAPEAYNAGLSLKRS
jgi:ubiquinone/menaquinone biosynthesis C-methylase UbiE